MVGISASSDAELSECPSPASSFQLTGRPAAIIASRVATACANGTMSSTAPCWNSAPASPGPTAVGSFAPEMETAVHTADENSA